MQWVQPNLAQQLQFSLRNNSMFHRITWNATNLRHLSVAQTGLDRETPTSAATLDLSESTQPTHHSSSLEGEDNVERSQPLLEPSHPDAIDVNDNPAPFLPSKKKRKNISKATHLLTLAFILYLACGTLFYALDHGNRLPLALAFFQSVSIGYSVGMSPKYSSYEPNPWFSTVYILIGSILIALLLTTIGQQVEERASMNLYDALQCRERYETRVRRDNPLCVRVKSFLSYHAVYLMAIAAWIIWLVFVIIWSMLGMENSATWLFHDALYFAFSMCSSAGSMSLPNNSPDWKYGLAACSMIVGVPLMAVAISCCVIMMLQGQRFKAVKSASYNPVSASEFQAIKSLGLGKDDELTKADFVLIGLLRMNQDGGHIQYLATAFDALDERGMLFQKDEEGEVDAHSAPSSRYSPHAKAFVESKRKNSNAIIGGAVSDSQWSTRAAPDGDV